MGMGEEILPQKWWVSGTLLQSWFPGYWYQVWWKHLLQAVVAAASHSSFSHFDEFLGGLENFSIRVWIPVALLEAVDSVIWVMYRAPWLILINHDGGWEGDSYAIGYLSKGLQVQDVSILVPYSVQTGPIVGLRKRPLGGKFLHLHLLEILNALKHMHLSWNFLLAVWLSSLLGCCNHLLLRWSIVSCSCNLNWPKWHCIFIWWGLKCLGQGLVVYD